MSGSSAAHALKTATGTARDGPGETLEPCFEIRRADVRYSAVAALGQQPALPETVLAELGALLRDPESDVRPSAAARLRSATGTA